MEGDSPLNYKLKTKLKGYVDVSKKGNKNNKEEFLINLDGGLIKGDGSLKINKLPYKQ